MKKQLFLIALFFGVNGLSIAQQQGLYSNFLLNGYIYNPALAGIEDHLDAKTSFRRQWINLPGSPTTMYASLHGAVNQKDLNKEELGSLPMRGASTIKFKNIQPKKMRHGVGGYFLNDKAGLITRNTINLGYSCHIPLNQTYYLAAGANLGAHFFSLGTPTLREQNDDAFTGSQNLGVLPDVQVGLFLYSDNLQLGLSGSQLAGNRVSFAKNNKSVSYNNLTRHFFATASYRIPLDQDFDLLPVGIIRYTENSPISYEGGAKIRYLNTFWAGATYRYGDAVSGMLGFSMYKFIDLCYAFDFTTSNIQSTSVGTHEIVLGLRLNNKKPNSSLRVW
jgi:type IX secretion system PorP/SprF family membrane protein